MKNPRLSQPPASTYQSATSRLQPGLSDPSPHMLLLLTSSHLLHPTVPPWPWKPARAPLISFRKLPLSPPWGQTHLHGLSLLPSTPPSPHSCPAFKIALLSWKGSRLPGGRSYCPGPLTQHPGTQRTQKTFAGLKAWSASVAAALSTTWPQGSAQSRHSTNNLPSQWMPHSRHTTSGTES